METAKREQMPSNIQNKQWGWLIGRRLHLGVVTDVLGETATVQHGNDVKRVPLWELIEDDYKSQDRYYSAMSDALNSGNGTYRP